MKEGIHPALNEVVISCACGHQIKTLSTGPKAYAIEICSNCHPFFTGKHKLVDSAGRVERFQKKYANFKKKPKH